MYAGLRCETHPSVAGRCVGRSHDGERLVTARLGMPLARPRSQAGKARATASAPLQKIFPTAATATR
jgi:hypothetical protein